MTNSLITSDFWSVRCFKKGVAASAWKTEAEVVFRTWGIGSGDGDASRSGVDDGRGLDDDDAFPHHRR